MTNKMLDLLLNQKYTLEGRLHFAKSEVKYWHSQVMEGGSRFLTHCAKIHYQYALRYLKVTFYDLRDTNQIIKEAKNA